jgi:hypothetical protein
MAAVLLAAVPASAVAATTGFIADGVCAVQGTMTFSPAKGGIPTPGTLVSVNVTSIACAGVPTGLTASILPTTGNGVTSNITVAAFAGAFVGLS